MISFVKERKEEVRRVLTIDIWLGSLMMNLNKFGIKGCGITSPIMISKKIVQVGVLNCYKLRIPARSTESLSSRHLGFACLPCLSQSRAVLAAVPVPVTTPVTSHQQCQHTPVQVHRQSLAVQQLLHGLFTASSSRAATLTILILLYQCWTIDYGYSDLGCNDNLCHHSFAYFI